MEEVQIRERGAVPAAVGAAGPGGGEERQGHPRREGAHADQRCPRGVKVNAPAISPSKRTARRNGSFHRGTVCWARPMATGLEIFDPSTALDPTAFAGATGAQRLLEAAAHFPGGPVGLVFALFWAP